MSYTATLVKSEGTSGGNSIRQYDIDPDAATGDFTVSDVDYVYVLGVVPLNEDPTGTTDQAIVQALRNSTTTNQVDFKLWASSFVAATTFKDFTVTVLCLH